jgi:hypothetical protein
MSVIRTWLRLAAVMAIAEGCSRGPSSATASKHTAAPAVVVANGFVYDPDEVIPAYPGVVPIRLGDRLRIYSIAKEWTPATLALLDANQSVLWSVRLDLPPKGSINGAIPAGIEFAQIRITQPGGLFDASQLERRIGVVESEWTASRMKEFGLVPVESKQSRLGDAAVTESLWNGQVKSCMFGCPPQAAAIIVCTPTGTMMSTVEPWRGTEPAPDDHWLDATVRSFLDEQRTASAGGVHPRD